MMIPTLHPELAINGAVYRAARLALLRQQMMKHFKRTDASAQNVERALATLLKANPHGSRVTHQ